MGGIPLPGLLLWLGLAMAWVGVLLMPHRRRIAAVTSRRAHAWHLLPAPPPVPERLPVEELAAKLRRLRPRVCEERAGLGMPKQRGIRAAYDDALVEMARALEVPTTLDSLPSEGFDHEVERLRLEMALTDAGLSWRVTGVDPAA